MFTLESKKDKKGEKITVPDTAKIADETEKITSRDLDVFFKKGRDIESKKKNKNTE